MILLISVGIHAFEKQKNVLINPKENQPIQRINTSRNNDSEINLKQKINFLLKNNMIHINNYNLFNVKYYIIKNTIDEKIFNKEIILIPNENQNHNSFVFI